MPVEDPSASRALMRPLLRCSFTYSPSNAASECLARSAAAAAAAASASCCSSRACARRSRALSFAANSNMPSARATRAGSTVPVGQVHTMRAGSRKRPSIAERTASATSTTGTPARFRCASSGTLTVTAARGAASRAESSTSVLESLVASRSTGAAASVGLSALSRVANHVAQTTRTIQAAIHEPEVPCEGFIALREPYAAPRTSPTSSAPSRLADPSKSR